jgi:hypothetical protein
MFPLVSACRSSARPRRFVKEIKAELDAEGIAYNRELRSAS